MYVFMYLYMYVYLMYVFMYLPTTKKKRFMYVFHKCMLYVCITYVCMYVYPVVEDRTLVKAFQSNLLAISQGSIFLSVPLSSSH